MHKRDLSCVTVDTTVQPKNVAFPTDAKLLLTAIRKLADRINAVISAVGYNFRLAACRT